jgi:hypothetical protein
MTAAAAPQRARRGLADRLRRLPAELHRREPRLAAFGLACGALCTAIFELAYITRQAARGEASHFNTADPLHALLYALMGLAAVALIATTLPLAWAIARRPAPGVDPVYRRAVLTGLVLGFLLGWLLGGDMSAQPGHAVGAEAGHLAVVGWNRGGGDLRVAHFLGMHAPQALPLAVAAPGVVGVRRRGVVLAVVAVLWTTLTLAAFAQAVAGRPFPFG